jgi:asparagine synthase (glutamine-hydrolysing)
MCGIFSLLNYDNSNTKLILDEFNKGKSRGPESSTLTYLYNKIVLGFHRLAINGLNDISNQPLIFNDIVLICNGEIYNYQQLYKLMNVQPRTGSDCEVIIHLYEKYGIEQTLQMLDGVFAFILLDNRIAQNSKKLYVARDPFGVRPLYQSKHNNVYGFASELKCLSNINENIKQYEPGSYSIFQIEEGMLYEPIKENVKYFIPSFSHNIILSDDVYYKNIALYLTQAVYKRCLTTERPIACLLSGGLDSSLIAALVNNFYKLNGYKQKLETYSIGLFGSEDLRNAKIVAEYLGTEHHEIIVSEDDMFNVIPELIYTIESYDTTTVRASIGNYLLGKYIAKNSQAKVIFNGDGSDELLGGYLYMNKCPDDIEFDRETRRLLKDIHLFDVLRSDKSISSNGLEPRTPFLDKNFVNYVLSIYPYFRNHKNHSQMEKYILRNSFSADNFLNFEKKELLPNEILWRRKEAFSDGVSGLSISLYQILQKKIVAKLNSNSNSNSNIYQENIETEKYYYRTIFENNFTNCLDILPYYWMPKYTNATDPSARTLKFYKD